LDVELGFEPVQKTFENHSQINEIKTKTTSRADQRASLPAAFSMRRRLACVGGGGRDYLGVKP
jgi:hypothetical protein